MLDTPSNFDIVKRIEMNSGKFAYVAECLDLYTDRIDQVFNTLSYFDTMNMAEKIKYPIFTTIGLKGTTAP